MEDQWLNGILKPFSETLSQDQAWNRASSNTLGGSNGVPLNRREFLCCQIVLVRAIHHIHLLLWFLCVSKPSQNWIKCLAGSTEKAPLIRVQLINSHHSPIVILQWKKRWPASSWWFPQRGQFDFYICALNSQSTINVILHMGYLIKEIIIVV